MPTISVIVPVYKVEAYLDRCVKSVLDQTFEDFELILVDDGSPDRCGAMCDEWAKKDNRIRVIHKKNGGLSDARNAGFDIAKAEWITFIDSDDYVHPKMLEALYNGVIEHGVKVSACRYIQTHGEDLSYCGRVYASALVPREFYREYNYATVAWGKMYHRDVILPYPVGRVHEDEYVTYRILFACSHIAVVDIPLYGYFQNTESITRSSWNPKRLDALPAFEEQIKFFADMGEEKILRWRIFDYMNYVITQIEEIEKMDNYKEEKKQLIKTGRHLLRRYRRAGIFAGERYLWIHARFYPLRTRWYGSWLAIWNKLNRYRKGKK